MADPNQRKVLGNQRIGRTKEASYRRKFDASPVFYINVGSLETASGKVIEIESKTPEARKYLPMTNVQVVNSSNSDIFFYPNEKSFAHVIPSNSNVIFDRNSLGGGVRSFKIYNSSATEEVKDKEVEITYWNEGIVVNSAFQKLHKALYTTLGK